MNNVKEQEVCEQSTGCVQTGAIVYYDDKGNKISRKEARKLIRENQVVEIPSAGAGSFRDVFEDLGFEEVETIDTTSSSGDWSIAVKNEYMWFHAWQENRYPYHGFRFGISDQTMPCSTFEDLCAEVEML